MKSYESVEEKEQALEWARDYADQYDERLERAIYEEARLRRRCEELDQQFEAEGGE